MNTQIVSQGRDWLDYLGAVVGLIGLAVVTAYTILTYRLLRTTRKALAETRRSNEATEKSNAIAERSLELGRRAWLVIDGIRTVDHDSIEILVKNVGAVPAIDVCIWSRVYYISPDSIPHRPEPPTEDIEGVIRGLVIGPGRQVGQTVRRPLASEKGVTVIAYCEIEYRDLFDKPYRTSGGWHFRPGLPLGREWRVAPGLLNVLE